jgi:hypothetical protein
MATDTMKRAVRTLAEQGKVRLTFDVPVEDANLLAETAERTGYNKVTTFMRAIRILHDLEKAIREGGQVIIQHADGTKERLLLR